MADCEYTGGSVAGAVIGTFLTTLVLIAILHFLWTLRRKQRLKKSGLANLVIVEDGGKNFSYDNPGFMEDTSETKKGQETIEGMKVNGKGKEEPQTYNVSLRGHDFTGLGFNICGNMKDGIYVKDVMQRGPAAESKRVLPGDQIVGMTVSFKQIVLEDAITLLSYASPYEVSLEMVRHSDKALPHKGIHLSPAAATGGTSDRICHPFFKSQSIDDLRKVGKEHLDLQIDRKKKANGLKGHTDARSSSSSNMSASKKVKEEIADEVDSPKVKVVTIKPSAMPRVKAKNVKASTPVEAISPVVVNMTMEGSEMKEMKEVIEEVQTSEMLSMKPFHVQIEMDSQDSMTMMSEVEAPIKKPERTSKKDKMKDEMKKPMEEGEGSSKEMHGKKMSADKEMKGEGEEQSLFGKFGIKLPEISLSFGRKSGESAEKEIKKKKSDDTEMKMEAKMSTMDEVDGDNVKTITIKPMPRDKKDEKRKAEEKLKEEKMKEEKRKEKEEKMKEEKMKEEKLKEEKMKEEKIKEEKMKEEKRLKEEKMKEEKRLKDEKMKEEKMREDKIKEEKKKEEKLKEEKLKEERMKEEKIKEEKRKEKMKEEKIREEKRKEEKLKEEKLKEEKRKEEKIKEEKRKEEKLKEEKLKEEKRKEKEEKLLMKKKMSMKEKEMENERKEEEMKQKSESSMDEMDDKEMSEQMNESKKKPVFHIPSLGLKLPKFVHSKQTYSFENSGIEKEGKMEEGMVIPTTSSILDSPTETKIMKVEMMSEEPSTSMAAEASMEEMKKSEIDDKEGEMKETKGGFMSKGIKSLKDLKVKMTQKLNHESESEEEEGEDGKKKKRDKSIEAKAREKMEKEERTKERAKEKEKAKAEKKQKKELKKKLSTSSTSGSAGGQDPLSGNNTSSSDESDSEESPKNSGTKKLKKEKGSKKEKMTKEKVKKSESMEIESADMMVKEKEDMQMMSKMPESDDKMKKQSSSSSESSESESEQKDSKPKKPKRSPKRKAPGPPMAEGKTITIAAEVMNPPKEPEEMKNTAVTKCDSHKTPESGRKSASFGDLSSLHPKQVDPSLLERAVSMDMASDENGTHGQMSQKAIPLMSPHEDLSAMSDSTTAMSQFKPKESLSSSSSSETLKASPTSIVHVFPKEQMQKVEMKEQEMKTDIQKMMEETVKTMNNIVHTMDERGNKQTEVTVSGPSYSKSNTMEVGQVAQSVVDEIISTSERSLTQSVQVMSDQPMTLTVDVGEMEMGNNVTVMRVMESGENGDNDNDMIIGEGGVKMRRGDSKTRLMQTVADANDIKISPVSGNSRRDSSTSSASSTSSDSSPDMREGKKANGGQMIEITSNELDGVMMSHAEFLARQNMEGVAGEPTSFDTWVYVEQKSDEPVSSSSASDPSSNDDEDQPRNGALSPTTFKMETEYETSELRVTTSPLSDDPKQAKVYSTTMTLPQKTITQIVLGQEPGQPFSIVDGNFSNGVIVSKITLDAKNTDEKRQEEMDSLPKLETLK